MLPIIIASRILFVACMVFIIGYVFGSFSKKPVLTTITKVASILVIALFISANVIAFRATRWGRTADGKYRCENTVQDSLRAHIESNPPK